MMKLIFILFLAEIHLGFLYKIAYLVEPGRSLQTKQHGLLNIWVRCFGHLEMQQVWLADNQFNVLWWLEEMSRSNKQALDYLSTIDFHDYKYPSITPDILDEVQNQFPSKQIWYCGTEFRLTSRFMPLSRKIYSQKNDKFETLNCWLYR